MKKTTFLIVGKHAVTEALKNPNRKIERVFLTEDAKKNLNREYQSVNLLKKVHVFYKSRKELDNLCGRDEISHQGLIAEVEQLDDLTLGEYIDLDTFIGDWENIEKAMAVLYRPVVNKLKDKYTIEEYKVGRDAEILDMPMDAVLSSIFFLWNLGLDLSKAMMNYLDKEETQALTQFLNSQPNGDGITQFTVLLKETLQDLKISLN